MGFAWGLCRASAAKPGKVTVTVSAEGLEEASVVVECEAGILRPVA